MLTLLPLPLDSAPRGSRAPTEVHVWHRLGRRSSSLNSGLRGRCIMVQRLQAKPLQTAQLAISVPSFLSSKD